MPSIEDWAKGTFAATAGLSTVAFSLLYYGQNYLIYPSAFPPGSRTEVLKPDQYGLDYHDLELTAQDGVKLRCYLLVQSKTLSQYGAGDVPSVDNISEEEFAAFRPTVIMFHGNGGNVGHRLPLARIFYVKLRCNVLMMSYRGYGLSEGTPCEKGLKQDAQAALDYVRSHPALSKGPTILYGQSIGGAVSIDLASRNPDAVSALILENTFLSIPRLIPSAIPPLAPFSFLCHQKWDSASKIHLIPHTTPVLMLSGTLDEVVPREHMLGLWELVQKRQSKDADSVPSDANVSQPPTSVLGSAVVVDPRDQSKFVEFPNGTHNDTCSQHGYWSAITEFLQNL